MEMWQLWFGANYKHNLLKHVKFHHRTRCKYDGKEKIKIRFDGKIWEGFTNKHYLRPLEEKNDDLIHDSLDEVEEEHPDTIDVNVRSTLDQDRLNKTNMQTKNFNKTELNHKGANDCYVLGRKHTSTRCLENKMIAKITAHDQTWHGLEHCSWTSKPDREYEN